ncbi:amidohydrolase family protein [Aliiglaciecola sp. CAU 1673]|uniref:amidohydrolase family protein n=1 Tax=Aliiglaciecola sp. CAU 1673 TaxID=3032595 RepID=UPI0023DAA383|nr:amidohydrolase family protein [Aliiglaciecola sp. CAU 1673]MDF2177386.1 amidohydrolase family protein [Aliiglaciecola sp. CAU 1673]
MMQRIMTGLFLSLLLGCSQPPVTDNTTEVIEKPDSEQHRYNVMLNGNVVGHLHATHQGNEISVDFDFKSNGRGPAYVEKILLNDQGIPQSLAISGNTTFGNKVDEWLTLADGQARWQDATGHGEAKLANTAIYVPQNSSPYQNFILAKALLQSEGQSLSALPVGTLTLSPMESLSVSNDAGSLELTSYALSGADLDPDYLILDQQQQFFAFISPRMIVIREGYEADEARFRQLSAKYATQRFEAIQAKFAHRYDGAVRIRNVRIFQPQNLSLSEPVSVLLNGERIQAIQPLDVVSQAGETEIDGAGGTLVPGLYEMHAHTSDDDGLMNVLAGVTTFRDMGNALEVLDELKARIDNGVLAGPRITRYGMIEGKSPSNNNNGILVETQEQAIEAVHTYAKHGFAGIKLYNSMKGEWAPALAAEAKRLNMRVTGHVPAFSNANAMIEAGFDEMTHINQVMLGWVLEPHEDTRTLLRLTALDRLPALDLNSDAVQHTLDLMVKNNVTIDPTLAIHEYLLLARNGETRVGVTDYIEHMPPGAQRAAKVSLVNIASPEQDAAYRGAYEKILTTLKMMKDKGIKILPGTDLGGAFNLHRELELYQQLGFTPAELLKLGSYDMAQYLGHEDRGSIEPGKLADFFVVPGNPVEDIKAIKTISLVSRGGVFYYPSEVYPEFGIKPFTKLPQVTQSGAL